MGLVNGKQPWSSHGALDLVVETDGIISEIITHLPVVGNAVEKSQRGRLGAECSEVLLLWTVAWELFLKP